MTDGEIGIADLATAARDRRMAAIAALAARADRRRRSPSTLLEAIEIDTADAICRNCDARGASIKYFDTSEIREF